MRKLVLLSTSGSPKLEINSVRSFLKNFLSDRNIIKINPILWYFILNFIILKKRPQKVLAKYQAVAIDKLSPLDYHLNKLICDLNENYSNNYIFKSFYCYIDNSLEQSLAQVDLNVIDEIIVLPLYPQYSNCTHLTIYSAIQEYVNEHNLSIQLSFIDNCYESTIFTEAILNQIHPFANKKAALLFSCHSIPSAYVKQGDSYYQHCQKMHCLLQNKLKNEFASIKLCFHSKFGKGKWLGPSLDETILDSLNEGIKDIVVVCAFNIDCLETLYDVHKQACNYAFEHKACSFKVVPCLNASFAHQQALLDLIKNYKRVIN